MEVKKVTLFSGALLYTKDEYGVDHYFLRIGPENWSELYGDSWEAVYGEREAELEQLFQETNQRGLFEGMLE